MTDNISVTPGTGATIAAENIGGILIQRVKLSLGVVDTDNGDVSATQPLPANVTMIGGSSLALGQQLAAASVPVVLTAAQTTSLTTGLTLGAGTALIGKFGIDQTTAGTTNAVSLSYVGSSALAFGSAVSASSIPVVTASDQVTNNPTPVQAVGSGFNRPATTPTYTIGNLVANTGTAGSVALDTCSVAKVNNQAFTLLRCRLTKSSTSLINASFRVHVYNIATPTFANGDNGAWSSSGFASYLGSFEVTMDKAFTDGCWGVGAPTVGPAIIGTPISGTTNIAYAVEARAAYVGVSAETFKATFEVA